MSKAVLDVNPMARNIVGARNATTNRIVAVAATRLASQLGLKAKKTARQIDKTLDPILLVGIAAQTSPLSQFSIYLIKDWFSLEE
jgi:hypothetical protein